MLATAPLGDHSPAGRRLVLDTIRHLQAHGDSSGSHAARAVAEQLLDRCRSLLCPDHPDTLTAASTLIRALVAVGEAEPARTLGGDTLQRCHRALGPNHLITLWVAATLTHALVAVGEFEPARALGQDTLQRSRRVLGPDNPISLHLTQAAAIAHLLLGGDAAPDGPSGPL